MAKSTHQFHKDWLASQAPVEAVLRHVQHHGFKATAPEQKFRSSFETRFQEVDDGDIHMEYEGEMVRVEVKQRPDMTFTGKEDFPFPTAIIEETYKLEKPGAPDLLCIVVCNRDLTHAGIAWKKHDEHWSTMDAFVHGAWRTMTTCPVKWMTWVQLKG